MDSKKYFFLAWTEEQLNCDAAALLLSDAGPSVLLWRKGLHRCLPEPSTK